ncbi:MAG TPA: hypothetical protein VE569_04900 [Acidimicrobiia bacterium]|jgi:hypothetical protein|nr:hypothetical protein [Acidimicrobiia bacterium]
MTDRAVGFGRGFPRTWVLPICALTILLGLGAVGRFSRSIVADLLAWWPVWLGLGVVAYLLRNRQVRVVRLAGLVPLIALGVVGLFAWAHIAGWSIMPSASQRLVGPDTGEYASARLVAVIDGRIFIEDGSNSLYRVEPIRQGGQIGIPEASEQELDGSLMVDLAEPADPGLYSYAGWDITLSSDPSWSLDLDGAVDANLAEIDLIGLSLGGAGEVRLGLAAAETPVTVAGDFHIQIPAGSAAKVIGKASVPDSWTLTEEGATSPGGSGGWAITVVGDGTLTVTERQ